LGEELVRCQGRDTDELVARKERERKGEMKGEERGARRKYIPP